MRPRRSTPPARSPAARSAIISRSARRCSASRATAAGAISAAARPARGTICETRNDWLATVRGRLGYAAGRFMPYVTGGAAFGNIKTNIAGIGTADQTRAGWTAGGGVEAKIAGPWSAKVEYLYVDLGRGGTGCRLGRRVPHQYRARRHQLSLLKARTSQTAKPRSVLRGFLSSARAFTPQLWSPRRPAPARRTCRARRPGADDPCAKCPRSAGRHSRARRRARSARHRAHASSLRRRCLQRRESARDLSGLPIEPGLHALARPAGSGSRRRSGRRHRGCRRTAPAAAARQSAPSGSRGMMRPPPAR